MVREAVEPRVRVALELLAGHDARAIDDAGLGLEECNCDSVAFSAVVLRALALESTERHGVVGSAP